MDGQELTLPLVIGAAAIDSINPCVFGVLIFLIAFMTKMFKSANKMLIFGLMYSTVVYLTYLLLGFGILKIAIGTGFATAFYWLAALIAIFAGLLEIKDYFWYGKGPSLQIIPGGGDRIKYYTSKIESMEQRHPALLILTTALLGVFVVLVELPCTGAPYLAVLGLLSQGEFARAIPFLLLYNFIFIIPLFVIIGISYFGTTSEALEEWRKEHRGLMRLGIGIFLLLLGFYMIYSLNPVF
jgi:cytochrome c biogenesis protein CcdA